MNAGGKSDGSSNINSMVKLVECPRDAMQGWKTFIPTAQKVEYLNKLLEVGFDTIDCASFVSPKAIPQMADSKEVISRLDPGTSFSKLLVIVANRRGAEEASWYEHVSFLGFPFSISETFQQRNTNSSIEESFKRVKEIQDICVQKHKQLVIYISMGFGNPYGDPYTEEIVFNWVNKISGLGVNIISLADTVGLASADQVFRITNYLVTNFPGREIGVHLHSTPANWKEKLGSALRAGCGRFDGALKGIGGCPMANDELVGNMDTQLMIPYFEQQGLIQNLNKEALSESLEIASQIFV
jgi:hydroxymethylglutaryl-CoA lyase